MQYITEFEKDYNIFTDMFADHCNIQKKCVNDILYTDTPNYKNYESLVKTGLALSKRRLELKTQFQDQDYVPDKKDFDALLAAQQTQRERERVNAAKFEEMARRAFEAEEKCRKIIKQNDELQQALSSKDIASDASEQSQIDSNEGALRPQTQEFYNTTPSPPTKKSCKSLSEMFDNGYD